MRDNADEANPILSFMFSPLRRGAARADDA
jgi:hypothetical protein